MQNLVILILKYDNARNNIYIIFIKYFEAKLT